MTQSDIINNNFNKVLKCIKSSNAYVTGEVSDELKGYSQLAQIKHSTFDSSKITIVGTPTISEDGVVSDFSTSNYVKTSINIDGSITKIREKFHISTFENTTISELYRSNCFVLMIGTGSNYNLRARVGNAAENNWLMVNYTILPNKDYIGECVINKTTKLATLNLYDENNNLLGTYTNSTPFVSITLTDEDNTVTIGYGNNRTFTNGTIDLKQFSITVDGKEVLSGNKTGIDVIKPDNYEVVGSGQITISEEGVLSGYNYSTVTGPSQITNYAYIPVSVLNQIGTNNWRLEWEHKLEKIDIGYCYDFGTRYADIVYSSLNIGRFNVTDNFFFRLTLDTNGTPTNSGNIPVAIIPRRLLDEKYKGVFEFENGVYTLTLNFENGEIYTNSLTSPYYFMPNGKDLWINSFCENEMDLNKVKLFINDNLAYQPCLKIPYTQSKTGSKIVDAVYRDRVIDLYEQTGIANYYTLDETNKNYTLPMGEIYGMLNNIASNITAGITISYWGC